MKLLQLYYTSCKKGRTPGNGFQVYSASDGLTEDEIRELERICLYIPPNHLPSQPTTEEIEREYPVSFSYFHLSSGRHGVCQSVYVGKDYSERYGNYFSHVLVLEEGEWEFPPIYLYGSPIFRKSLTLAELEIDRRPDDLPILKLEEPNGSITLTDVKQFLKLDNRYERLKDMLNGLMIQKGNPETLILVGNVKDIPYWIAAIHLSFPLQIANQLTFSTYVYDPDREDYVISTVIDEGTRFSFQDVLRRSNMYGFDFKRELFSDVEDMYRYPEVVAQKQLEMEHFRSFFHGFGKVKISEHIDHAYDLFTLIEEPIHQLEPQKIHRAIQFASEFVPIQKAGQLLNELSIEQLILFSLDLETATMVSGLIIDISNQTKNPEHIEKSLQYIFETVKDFVTDGIEITEIESFLDEQLKKMDFDSSKISKKFCSKENLLLLHEQLIQMNDLNKEFFYLNLLIKFLTKETVKWNSLLAEQKNIICYLVKRQLDDGSHALYDLDFESVSADFFAGFITSAYKLTQLSIEKTNSLFQLFIQVMDKKAGDESWVIDVLQTMSESEEGTTIVYERYKKQLENKIHKTKALIEIVEELKTISSYRDRRIIDKYVDEIFQKETSLHHEVTEMISNTEIWTMLAKEKCLETIFNQFMEEISFSNENITSNLALYEKVINYYNTIGKQAFILELAVATFKVKMKEKNSNKKLEELLVRSHSELTDSQLGSYFAWCLPEIINIVYAKRKETSALVDKLIRRRPNILLEALVIWKRNMKLKYAVELFVDVYIGFVLTETDKEEEENIISFLLENDDVVKNIQDKMKVNNQAFKKWGLLYEEVQSRKGNSVVRSLKKMFGSKR